MREFGDFKLDPQKKVLFYKNKPLDIPLKEIELLCVLTENSGELVTKEELLNHLWADSYVEESNLTRHIYQLRKIFKQCGESEEIIQNVPRRGYRFAGEINNIAENNDLIIEKHTFTQTLIEEIEIDNSQNPPKLLSKPKSNLLWIPLIGIILGCLFLVYFFYSQEKKISISSIKSIAVLPIKSFDNNSDDEELRLRMMDSLITKLGKIETISVRPTASMLKFAKSDTERLEIGKQLEVDAIIDGRIQREGSKIRVNVQLVSVKTGEILWTDQFDGEDDKLLNLQDTISAKLLTNLDLTLSNDQEKNFNKLPTSNSEAYEEYLKGRYFWQKRSAESLKTAILSFEKAINLDKNFAEAYIGLADSSFLLFDYSYDTSPRNVIRAQENLAKAIELNPNLAEAYATLGYIQTSYEWNWKKAEQSFRKSIELAPNYPNAHHRLGILLLKLRRFSDAETELKRAKSLDPTSPSINMNLGVIFYFSKKFDEAENQFNKAIELDSKFNAPQWYLARCQWMKGNKEGFIEGYAQAIKNDGDEVLAKELEKDINLININEVLEILAREWEKQLSSTGINEHDLAIISALQGNKDKTLKWLEKSVDAHHPWSVWINAEPEFDFVRDDVRFQNLLHKLNFQ